MGFVLPWCGCVPGFGFDSLGGSDCRIGIVKYYWTQTDCGCGVLQKCGVMVGGNKN